MQSPSIKTITHTRVNARIETKKKEKKNIYMYICWLKIKNPKNSKKQKIQKAKNQKAKKR